MVTTKTDAIHFMKIMLDWMSRQVARSMLDDMDFYIAETTDNESVRDSIKMVREFVYKSSIENQPDEIDRKYKKAGELLTEAVKEEEIDEKVKRVPRK